MYSLLHLSTYTSAIMSVITLVVFICKPMREKLFGISQMREGQKCLLRASMLRIYYAHNKENKIRQYEFESFMLLYAAYKAHGGNSFIDKVKDEIKTWEVEA